MAPTSIQRAERERRLIVFVIDDHERRQFARSSRNLDQLATLDTAESIGIGRKMVRKRM